jgi:hypothetical protein
LISAFTACWVRVFAAVPLLLLLPLPRGLQDTYTDNPRAAIHSVALNTTRQFDLASAPGFGDLFWSQQQATTHACRQELHS